ncbi:hypothetical protein CPB86DRAFT_133907 [Serendipita vermifera]|nr:hypothetical protein CPB86DRAFT_133907 [Serendipita vermifera]
MDFLNSLLILLIGTAYTFLGTPYAPIYSKVPFESLEPVCATNTPQTGLDKSLCEQLLPKYAILHVGGTGDETSLALRSTKLTLPMERRGKVF